MLSLVPGSGDDDRGGHDGPGGVELGGEPASVLDQIVREGAQRMLAEALQADVEATIAAFAAERDEQGRRLVVRNGSHEPRRTRNAGTDSPAPERLQNPVGCADGRAKRSFKVRMTVGLVCLDAG